MTTAGATVVWFRADLRLDDHPALGAAVARGEPVVPVFVWAPEEEGPWAPGGASRVWLHHSLEALGGALSERGLRLVIRRGPTLEALRDVVRACGATAVHWNRRYEPGIIERDADIKKALRDEGIEAESWNGSLLFEPHRIRNKSGGPFQVFTPFWKHCLSEGLPSAGAVDLSGMKAPDRWPPGLSVAELELLPGVRWDVPMMRGWEVGEAAARHALARFASSVVDGYRERRDQPGEAGTSRLSPHLHFGEISPRTVADALMGRDGAGVRTFLSEVGWREFGYHLLYHFPRTPERPLRSEFERFPWSADEALLEAWRRGRTGYPIVDAGMRELWATGWMHNRVRMIVASVLVKHLLQPWQEGARWFWDTLVDADLASNTLGWQWTAGCGADAAPYFRIFNPMTQGSRFDGAGAYVRRWVPEVRRLPDRFVHEPWAADRGTLADAGIRLGTDYPRPVVEHSRARQRALDAYQAMRGGEG